MFRNHAFAMTLALTTILLASSLGLGSQIGHPQPATSPRGAFYQGQLIIYASGALSQPNAPISVSGSTYTLTARFNGTIVDDRNGSVLNGAGFTLNVTPLGATGVDLQNDNGVTVENLRVINASIAVYGYGDTKLTLTGNRLNATQWGAYVDTSSLVQIARNNLSAQAGIYVQFSSGVGVSNNNLTTVSSYAFDGYANTDLNVSSNAIGATNVALYEDYGKNLTFYANRGVGTGSETGIGAYYVTLVRMIDNSFPQANTGIDAEYDTGVLIAGNYFFATVIYGIEVDYALHVRVVANNASSSYTALYLDADSGVFVGGLAASGSSNYAVEVGYANDTTLTRVVASNSDYGIYVYDSYMTVISKSDFTHARIYGVYLYYNTNLTQVDTNASSAGQYGMYSEYNQNVTSINDSFSYVSAVNYGGIYTYYDRNDVFIGTHVDSSYYGIYAEYTMGLDIVRSSLVRSGYSALYLYQDANVVVLDSNLSFGFIYGIYDDYSSNLWLQNDSLSWFVGEYGLYVAYDYGTVSVLGSTMNYDYYGAYIEANSAHIYASNFSQSSAYGLYTEYVMQLTVNGCWFYNDLVDAAWYEYESTVVSSSFNWFRNDYYGIEAYYETKITTSYDVYVNDTYGIYTEDVYGSTVIQHDRFLATTYPIEVYYPTSVAMVWNNITGGAKSPQGIYLTGAYAGGTIADNQLIGSTMNAIYISNSNALLVASNDLRGSTVEGIYGSTIDASTFVGNDLSYTPHGLALDNTTASTFQGNVFVSDAWSFTLNDSYGNQFFHNDFIGDRGYVFWGQYTPNEFNVSAPIGGNYWSNYTGTDGDHDGFGDTPQNVAGTWVRDYLPLMHPWAPYTVTFLETGLPAGTSWNVTLGGITRTTTGTAVAYTQVNGAYTPFTWSITPIAGYVASPWSGNGTWNSTNQVFQVTFTPYTYLVSYQETGLPAGTSWTVSSGSQSVSSTTADLNLSLPNGTSAWAVTPVAGYVASPTSGSVSVAGASPGTVVIAFQPFLYPVTFNETGLPAGTSWSLAVNGGPATATTSTSLTFWEPNGTATYVVTPMGAYVSAPGSGMVTVAASAARVGIVFTPRLTPTYGLTFSESGLTSGASWSVLVGGLTVTGTTPTLTTHLTNGSYTFAVGGVAGFVVAPGSGTVVVNGASQTMVVRFASAAPATFAVTFAATGLPSGTSWSVDVGGSVQATTTASATVLLVNGSYSYSVTAPSGYTASPVGGHFSVNGNAASVTIAFSAVKPASQGLSSTDFGLLGGLLVVLVLAVLGWILYIRSRKGPRQAANAEAPAAAGAAASAPAEGAAPPPPPGNATSEPAAPTTAASPEPPAWSESSPTDPSTDSATGTHEESGSSGTGEPPAPPSPAPGA